MRVLTDERSVSIQTRILYWFVTLLASLNFSLAYVRLLHRPFSFLAYAHGGVPYPQQSRILMANVFALTQHSRLLALLSAHARRPLDDPQSLLMVIVAFCAMLIAVSFVRLSLNLLIEDRSLARWGSLLVIFMAYFQYILPSDSPFLYPYDLPSLAVFSAGIYLLLRRRWVLYYLLFIVGTFNRETTCFLTGFMVMFQLFPFDRGEMETPYATGDRKKVFPRDKISMLGMHVLIQMLLWLAIRYYSAHFFSAMPHYAVDTWMHNFRHGFSPKHWASLFSSFGFLWIIYLLEFKRIPYKGLRWCAWLLVLWFATMLCVGWIYEIRIFGELIPYIAICIALIVNESVKVVRYQTA